MEDMDNTETTTPESSEWRRRSNELVRPVEGRMLAGVAKGVADNFGLSEWIPRVFFVVTAFMGGLGIVLYLACWAFVRSEDESESIADRFFSGASSSRSWFGIGLIVVAGMIILANFTFLAGEVIWAAAFLVVGLLLYTGNIPTGTKQPGEVSVESKEGVQQMTTTDTLESDATVSGDSPAGGLVTPPPAPPPTPTPPDLPPAKPRETSILGRLTVGAMLLGMGILAVLDNIDALAIDAEPRHYLALAVTILGIGLLVGSVLGRARWLILIAVIMIPTLAFSPAFEYDWDSSSFNSQIRPTTFEEVEPRYELDIGRIHLDLHELPWAGQELVIDAEVAVGSIEIEVPDGVGIVGTATVDIGVVSEPGRSSSGLGDPNLDWDDPGDLGTVRLDAAVNVGNIEISR
jgi:phage shock protein PspC (stress-responsive transcriptional regulator)